MTNAKLKRDFEQMFNEWLIDNKKHNLAFETIQKLKRMAYEWFLNGIIYNSPKTKGSKSK